MNSGLPPTSRFATVVVNGSLGSPFDKSIGGKVHAAARLIHKLTFI
jgi:hypothetical protein